MRKPYLPDESEALARIEARRIAANISRAMLAIEAGMSERTLAARMKSGRVSKRQVNALAMAMRSFERGQQPADEAFPCD